jgi:transcriptional regulator with XRE-family HTH domain
MAIERGFTVTDKDLGAAVRELRERIPKPDDMPRWLWHGMSMAAVAKALGTSRTTVTNVERGSRSLGAAELWTWAAVLQSTPAELLRRAEKIATQTIPPATKPPVKRSAETSTKTVRKPPASSTKTVRAKKSPKPKVKAKR